MDIRISSDSTCDLSPEIIKKFGINIVPLTIIKDSKPFSDGIDIIPDDIFTHVTSGGELCTTCAVNTDSYVQVFKKLLQKHEYLIHICIGSGFSSCYQNACQAAAGFKNVYVIDSQNLSTGHGHVVLEACKMASSCSDIAAICKELNELTARVEASFLLDRLDYMVKGGRCSTVMALGANLLKLKPCIEVVGGKMTVGKKYRGEYSRCLSQYVSDRLFNRDDIEADTLFITHTPVTEKAMMAARAALERHGSGFSHIYDTKAGCTVSCHCGPGTLGVLFIRKKKY